MEECSGTDCEREAKQDCSRVVFHVNVSLYLCYCGSLNVSIFPLTVITVMQKNPIVVFVM